MASVGRLKSSLDELALLGGEPAFPEPLHVGRPNVGDRQAILRRIADALDRRWLTNEGRYVLEFEQRLADAVGARHCVATCNGTLALQVAVRALGLRGEVVMPSLTFVASAHALAWEGLVPVFADVDPASLCLAPERAAAVTGPRTGALLGVHLWGRTCDVEALRALASERGLALVLDAAQALGCSHGGTPIGAHGDATIFSFHATKVANSFEGGAIATDDPELAERAAHMRNFGFGAEDVVVSIGTNAKMSEPAAAMGLASLDALDSFVERNRQNYERYRQALAPVRGVQLLPLPLPETSNCHYIVVVVDPGTAGISRDELQRVLVSENVLARRYFYPGCHRMEPYRSRDCAHAPLPVTERLLERCLSLPTGTATAPEAIDRVCGLIELAVRHGDELATRLRAGQ
ncbi:MAG: DegT/DnrJ/EryC1/StrS family aminotransferase [Actinomycetota bacterium]|nr:DegT/DnrJ/EryC1/StrS family aminotransferase [Actinomycetota bacterium]